MATYDPTLLDAIENLGVQDWHGPVWRHMFNDNTPDRVNTGGARWNPPGIGAIYTGLERATALAEGQHAIDSQPLRTPARRVLYEVEVAVVDVVDLTAPGALTAVGLDLDTDLRGDDWEACQRVGGAASWLGRGGLIVPSARATGGNLVILVGSDPTDDMTILTQEAV